MDEHIHLGWLVASAAVRETITQIEVRVRPFTVGTFHRDDAERYAIDQMVAVYPPSDSWSITVSAMPITWPAAPVAPCTQEEP